MEKTEINEIFRKMFVMDESFDEDSFQEEHPNWYQGILEVYDAWDKALRLNGINQKKLKERRKFFVYCQMDRKFKKQGEEALRLKNIDDQTKEQIGELFPTIKSLLETVRDWNGTKVLYEMRKKRICGKDLNDVKQEQPLLYEALFQEYGDLEQFEKEYEARFGITKFKQGHKQNEIPLYALEELKGKRVVESVEAIGMTGQELMDILITLGVMDEEEGQKLLAVSNIRHEDMFRFLFQTAAECQQKGLRITDEVVKANDLSMYYAIKSEYGGVEEAFSDALRSVVGV